MRYFLFILVLGIAHSLGAMQTMAKIYVAGHRGLVGSALVRALEARGFDHLLVRTHAELDLTDREAVDRFFAKERPDFVFLAAAKVGGIKANFDKPVEFMVDNMRIEMNVLEAAHKYGVKKLLFLGSSCIYPKHAEQPIREEALLTGSLEPTNDSYALAKISGVKLCQAYNREYGTTFISCMPTNLYGPGDNYDLNTSHVMPALIRKMVEAKVEGKPQVEIWGSGRPRREFLHVDDLAEAALFLMEKYEGDSHVNVGTGKDIPIGALAHLIKEIVGYEGELVYNRKYPDGTMLKRLDVSKLTEMGWSPKISLREGLEKEIRDYSNRV